MSTNSEQDPSHPPIHSPGQNDVWTAPPAPPPHQPLAGHHLPAPHPGAGPAHFGPGYAVQARNPVLFALASLLIGGLGTMLAGKVGRGVVIFGVMVFNGMLVLIPFIGLLFVPVALGLWIFSGFDGYRTAQKWNASHGIIS